MQVFLIAANFELDRITSHKHGLAAKTVSKWRPRSRSFKTNFFFITGTLEAETSVYISLKFKIFTLTGDKPKIHHRAFVVFIQYDSTGIGWQSGINFEQANRIYVYFFWSKLDSNRSVQNTSQSPGGGGE